MGEFYNDYFSYLKKRGRLGYIYRQYWLYPTICHSLNGKVLDVGCGIGDFLRYRPNTQGVDVNPKTVEYCKERGLDVQLMELDRLPFESSSFDSVVLDNVLEHIENPESILKEIKRVLVDKGIFVVGVPGIKGYASDSDHKVFYSKEGLVEKLNNAGFSEINVFGMPLDLDWLDNKMKQYSVFGVFRK